MTSGNDATVPVRMFYSKQITMMGALLGSKRQLAKLMNFIRGSKILPIIDSIFELHNAEEAQEKDGGRDACRQDSLKVLVPVVQ